MAESRIVPAKKNGRIKHANVSIFVPHVGCPNQCSFCNQRKISGAQQAPTPQQVREVCQKAAELRKGKLRDTQLAFFGGSFTAIERGYMLSLLEAAKPFVGENGFAGIRISTRPDAINEEILTILKEYHVNTIELGVQSMNDRVLLANKRGHTAQDVVKAAEMIQDFQIELGLQMMTGLYQSTWKDDVDTAKAIAALHPKTVRIYPTITLEGTDLAALYQQGLYQPMSLEDSVKLCSELLEFFEEQDIQVIRLGLHAQESLEQGYLAGPYHPAFRELCEGRIYLKKALLQIDQFPEKTPLTIYVNSKELSKMAGQSRCNLNYLKQRNPIKIKPDDSLEAFCVRVESV